MSLSDPILRARLLRLARGAIEADLTGRPPPPIDPREWPPELGRRGVFVTLRKLDRLRGCIGTFLADDALPAVVARMAVAAGHDPRFSDRPISLSELSSLRIELSILATPVRTADPLGLERGRHGIYIRVGQRAGCFLPDVATQYGWTNEQFLTECCRQKVGSEAEAWREPDTEVYLFTVEKIVEASGEA